MKLRRRTAGERRAYVQGYAAGRRDALRRMRRAIDKAEAAPRPVVDAQQDDDR